METKYFEKLEFNKIREILKEYALTFIGKKMSLELCPINNKKDIEKAGSQTFEASNLIYRKGNAPISEVVPIDEHLKILHTQGTLSAKYLLDLANILKIQKLIWVNLAH